MLVLLLLAEASEPALTAAREKLSVERRCVVDPHTTDVTVCGLRNADRFRVPFVIRDPGDPRHEAVAAERQRLQYKRTPLQQMGPFQVGGGMVGATVTAGAGGVRAEGARPLAP